MSDSPGEQPAVILYGHSGCPAVAPTRALLNQAGMPHTYINIRQDDNARERVRTINHGYESVPTLEFPDGSTLTEPTFGELRAKLKVYGYTLPASSWLIANWQWVVIALGVAFVVLRTLNVL